MYITPDRNLARAYAGGWCGDGSHFGYGWLYEVHVDDELLEPDPDLLSLPGVSFQASVATIARVAERSVRPDQRRFAETFAEILDQLRQATDL